MPRDIAENSTKHHFYPVIIVNLISCFFLCIFFGYSSPSLVPRLPPLTRNYCVTFELVPAFLHEFKGHAIIARKGGEPGNEATPHPLYIFYDTVLLYGRSQWRS